MLQAQVQGELIKVSGDWASIFSLFRYECGSKTQGSAKKVVVYPIMLEHLDLHCKIWGSNTNIFNKKVLCTFRANKQTGNM